MTGPALFISRERAYRNWQDAVQRDEDAKRDGARADRRKAHAEVMMAWARLSEVNR